MKFNDIPVALKQKLNSDFAASAVVTLVSGLAFMGLVQLLVMVFPVK
ncbi:hypothetical protein KKF34_14275 [Myxococcota bacterium]|nr:hypothetical protein [Myxococcota bacterium]MBU1380732.1 hypothetical protein [Myxococcota bacterium]MBU1498040.1 hypothetical protein [Myxococcota bacterium]